MKSLNEIFETLQSLNALTKATFLKSAKASGFSKEKIEEFWAETQPKKVKPLSLTSMVASAIIERPNLTTGEMIKELDRLGESFGRTENSSWKQARGYFLDQWQIGRSVYLRYAPDKAEAEEAEAEEAEAEEADEDQSFEDLGLTESCDSV